MDQTVPFRKLLLRIFLRLLLMIVVLLFILLFLPPLLKLFAPFVLAFLAASLLAPAVKKFSKNAGKVWNFWSMLFVILMLLAATGLLIYVGYYLVMQVADLIESWDSVRDNITGVLDSISRFISEKGNLTSTELEDYLIDFLQKGLNWITEKLSSWAPTLMTGVGNLASGIASFVVSLLFFIVGAYFMTADYPNIRRKLRQWTPEVIRPHVQHLKNVTGSAMFGYLRAQLILSSAVALIVFLALLIWGQDYSILIALAVGFIDIVPFFGSGVILIPWAIIMLVTAKYKKALFLLALSLALFLFRKLAEPKVVGNQTGLSPIVSLISIYVGMRIGGVLGMIFVPILCMIVIGLHNLGFFTPTIQDFRMLFARILAEASLSPSASTSEQASEESYESQR
ncbi:MAG: sporulation integral membrane protein YtvI [Oscillospiraceae bacterium]|nr:sporulation integral membrane protein YtvI [Oscillospiraceae bacterium]